jgi:hypothetical protein
MDMPLLPLKWINLMPAAAVEFVNSMGIGCWACAWLEMRSGAESRHTKKNMPSSTLTHRYVEQNAFIIAGAFQIKSSTSQSTSCGAALEQHSGGNASTHFGRRISATTRLAA